MRDPSKGFSGAELNELRRIHAEGGDVEGAIGKLVEEPEAEIILIPWGKLRAFVLKYQEDNFYPPDAHRIAAHFGINES
jgi:hypothetical protein